MPLRIWLPAQSKMPLIGPILAYPTTAWIASWAAMFFDCSIPFLLTIKRTRWAAWFLLLFFHCLTGYWFQIGVFPLVMTGATLLFFDANLHTKILHKLGYKIDHESPLYQQSKNRTITYVFVVWFLIQISVPLRYLAYPGNHLWTEQGYRFGWRVMLMEKAGTAIFYVNDRKSNKEGIVDNSKFLNPHQEKQMSMQPDMILQYAKFLKKQYEEKGLEVDKVRAEVYVTLNAKPSKLIFSDSLNLLQIKDSWAHKSWLNEE